MNNKITSKGKNFWMVSETNENFKKSQELNFSIHGLKSKYRKQAKRMEPNDRVLFYIYNKKKWALTATITSKSFIDNKTIWTSIYPDESYPNRVYMQPDIILKENNYIDAMILAPSLEYLKKWLPEMWPLAFYENLHLIPSKDFNLIESEMKRLIK